MPGTNLTHDEARERAALVAADAYEIALDLSRAADLETTAFASVTVVRFAVRAPGSTFLDLVADSVQAIDVDGRGLDPREVYDGARIRLDDLAAGDHTVRVTARCRYMTTGEGLHRFVDPADGLTYLYTQFEVPDSRRVFAVFEQPDLKATFRFTVTAPADWLVLSGAPSPAPVRAGEAETSGSAVWAFPATPPLSSYVTAIVAGPYRGSTGELTSRDGRTIPLGVYCRASLAEHLEAEEILDTTRRGFAFYEEAFETPYPFDKYDQVFVPEFNAGAMENAGCITFTDTYVFRSKVAESVRERRAITVLHELAHMWFGDLVTMRWWDDLWLNESFAEYASTLAAAEATRWTQAWTTFTAVEKTWAYRQDQLPTTHPVIADIRDLADVEVNFDGITYAKGASVLKQLVHWVGREQFFTGLRAYFRRHAWGNAEFTDLLRELSAASGRELDDWVRVWLQTAGVTVLRPRIEGEVAVGAPMASVTIEQEAPAEHPVLRPHRLAVGCYDLVDEALVRTGQVTLDVDGAATPVTGLADGARPALLLVNDDDHAYAKIRLDEVSAATAVDHLSALGESMPRRLVWAAMWDMTRDAELPARRFVDLVLRHLASENESSARSSLLSQLSGAVHLFTAEEHRSATADRVADALWAGVRDAEPGSDAQLQLVRAFLGLVRTEAHREAAAGLLDGSGPLAGLVVDTDLRWDLVGALAASDPGPEAESLVAAELARDDTATGRRAAAAARAARPTPEAKEAAWAEVMAGTLSNAVQDSTIGGWSRAHDPALLAPFVERYFEALLPVWRERTLQMAEQVVLGLYPGQLVTEDLVARGDAWLAVHPEAPAGLRRLVLENRDSTARALRARARDADGG
ncbi:MAG: aminopeptidase N [Kineosporiaceae bacterium]